MNALGCRMSAVFALALGALLLLGCASVPKPGPGFYSSREHRFSLEYPEGWQPDPLQPNEVLRAADPNPYKLPVVTAAVAPLKQNASLDPQAFTSVMHQRIPGTSGFEVLSQRDVILNDSTPARAFTFEWLWVDGETKMLTAALITIKDGKYFNATVTNVPGSDPGPEEMLALVESWKFY